MSKIKAFFMSDNLKFMQIYDIIIIGAGTAGMACAITAAERGRTVLVIEKDNRIGGTLHLTAGQMSGSGSRAQKQKGIADSPQQHFEDVMHINNGSADAWMIKLATDEAPQTLDWLDDLGIEWAENSPALVYGHVPYQIARTHFGKDMGRSILKILEPPFKKQVAKGTITLKLNTQFHDLILDNQTVIGIVAIDEEGERCSFFGHNTVLTTGGYASNPTLFAQKHPSLSRLISTASPNSQGDGIVISERHGAVFQGAEKALSTNGGIELDPLSGRTDFWGLWCRVSNSVDRPPHEIYVDDNAHRFIAEDEPSPDVRERVVGKLPNRRFWVIFDEHTRQTAPFLFLWWTMEQFLEETKREKAMWQADNLAELASKTGLPKEQLLKTIQQFNGFIDKKNDPHFGRKLLNNKILEPPYYAVLTYALNLITFGGIKVNEQLAVMHQNGQPINRLYAAGEILGAGATSGNAFCGGMLITPALSFGRILGRQL
jgi:flavocytochrome c